MKQQKIAYAKWRSLNNVQKTQLYFETLGCSLKAQQLFNNDWFVALLWFEWNFTA